MLSSGTISSGKNSGKRKSIGLLAKFPLLFIPIKVTHKTLQTLFFPRQLTIKDYFDTFS
jgi:hypothetical protein